MFDFMTESLQENFALLAVLLVAMAVVAAVVAAVMVVAMLGLFEKASEPGWAAFVPIYNLYVLMKIVWGDGWTVLLVFAPVGWYFFLGETIRRLTRVFGKRPAFSAGIAVLPCIFLPVLAFGNAEYRRADGSSKKEFVILAWALSAVWVIFLISSGSMLLNPYGILQEIFRGTLIAICYVVTISIVDTIGRSET